MSRITLLLILLSSVSQAQDIDFLKSRIDSLCAPRYHGRGYVENGDVKAASFRQREVTAIGLSEVQDTSTQPFELGVNTFPGKMSVSFDSQELKTGVDYIIDPRSMGLEGEYKTFKFKDKWIDDRKKLFKIRNNPKLGERAAVIDLRESSEEMKSFANRIGENPLDVPAYVILTPDKLTWSIARRTVDFALVRAQTDHLEKDPKSVTLQIDQEWIGDYSAQNVIGMIPGESDSMIVFTAHYDHLGRMGKDIYIPGANDNASGSAMLLDLAKDYVGSKPKHTLVFIWFAGEEAGLVGSRYFVDNPMISLEKIKFLINLDLMGDAGKGITAVNGKIFTDHFDQLVEINTKNSLLDEVKARGVAANSDHFPFFEKGVPCFFIYTRGEYMHYHDVNDKPENLTLVKYGETFQLIKLFAESL